MRKLLGGVAAIAMLATAGVASAANHQTTNQRHYALDLGVLGGPVLTDTNPSASTAAYYDSLLPLGNLLGFGTRYTATTSAPDDTETANSDRFGGLHADRIGQQGLLLVRRERCFRAEHRLRHDRRAHG